MHAHKKAAKSTASAKMSKMLGQPGNGMAGNGVEEDYGTKAAGPSDSARYFKRGGAVEGEKAKARLDRPSRKGYAHGGTVKANKGKTNVNIIIAPQGAKPDPMAAMAAGGAGAPPMPLPRPPMAAPPAMPPGGMPPGAGGPPPMGGMPPQMMGRKKGGRVTMEAGAGSGLGRLEKIKEYGANAKG